ncbi:D-tyrosyl-tRNA(Tyr) deacylase [Nostoc commune NIES-4072]|uniref:D-tyrosyl-tRNA(Tyr) deacylase n=1 Tax=Nostoc commune NIES-4072 TaxID=2005467 RepID=A0A2R5FRJ1_NOSCO|nr:D-tyrosyl-tRNA(Tyr) deacylase [Nostoc commune HK-02]GBG21386.1 D-tyrosyl-tRNA(Tyr) deacylase [Nostoc commune NIES-4072]
MARFLHCLKVKWLPRVPQCCCDCRKGRRPSFDRSAAPQSAADLYNRFVTKLKASGLQVETGQFGAMMHVTIENDGPVTLLLEKEAV